jgi:UDP-N-acetylglucosamine 2-epimerase (non-hydrolysing)
MEAICDAVLELLGRYDDLRVVYPVHLSPQVRRVVQAKLSDHPRVELTEPLDYTRFVWEMSQAYLILTDSGGVQEEAPSLGKPVLVMRETTERPEAAEAGVAMIIGAHRDRIVESCSALLDDHDRYRAMARAKNPYGDGKAAVGILDALADVLPAKA